MKTLSEHLKIQLEKLPEFITSKDLIKLGIFANFSAVSRAKCQGWGPPSLSLGTQKTVYPKAALIEWLIEKENNF